MATKAEARQRVRAALAEQRAERARVERAREASRVDLLMAWEQMHEAALAVGQAVEVLTGVHGESLDEVAGACEGLSAREAGRLRRVYRDSVAESSDAVAGVAV